MPCKLLSVLSCLLVLPALLLAPAGCGSGSGGGTPAAFVDTSMPTELQQKSALTEDDKIHFLRRTHFAFRQKDLDQLNQMGFQAYLDWMLSPTINAQLEADALAATVADPDYPTPAELSRWWLYMMVNNPNPFQEVLAMFWHDHFAASTEVLPAEARWWGFSHINLWRNNGLIALPSLLHAMSIDWLMLEWLDGVRSTANSPNENFAREFWELFTLGADNGYTQNDIIEASKCFTGFRTTIVQNRAGQGRDQLVVVFNAGRHNNSTKYFFDKFVSPNGAQEYLDVVNLTLAERPAAAYICYKVWLHFIHTDPPPPLLFKMADHLQENNYSLKELFRMVLSCNEFFSDKAKAGLIKAPVEHVVGFLRGTGLEVTWQTMDVNLVNMGQRPSQPPTVNGWPGGDAWLSSQGLLERVNFLRDVIVYRRATGPQIDMATLIDPLQTTDTEVVDQLAWRLQVKLTTAQRDECIDYLNSDRQANGTIISQPWDINDAVQRDKKIRGLLYILGQHPTYAIR